MYTTKDQLSKKYKTTPNTKTHKSTTLLVFHPRLTLYINLTALANLKPIL